ncbi:MAG: hypothetical protein FJ288_14585 [Planctomycetes bacterium]|nr:hypothetical protein [Planctomycetota bacterium]
MKSKHRHELRTNELADAIGRAIEWGRPHGRVIGYAAAGVLVLVVVLVVLPAIRGSAAARNPSAEAFQEARLSGQVQPLRNFLVDFPKAEQAPAAGLLLAGRLVDEVVRGLSAAGGEDSQTKAAKLLAEAKDLYTQAALSPALEPLAQTGLALVTVQEGDLDKGRAALQEVITKWPQSLGAEKARASLEALAGYKPVVFSSEPLEEPKPPEAKPAEAKPAAESKPAAPAPPDAR